MTPHELRNLLEKGMRGRSYSYSPSPPRGYERRGHSPSPRGRYGGRGRDLPTSLLVRNLRRDCRPEDLRRPFGQFGPLKDIYLPRDYYTGYQVLEEFEVLYKRERNVDDVEIIVNDDAADAKYHMDRQILLGRELTVVFAEENRKKPFEMRSRQRRGRDYRRSPRHSRSPRSRSRSPQYSRPPRDRSRSQSHSYKSPSPNRRHQSRSVSPHNGKPHRERSYSHSPAGSRSRSRSPGDLPE
ncbi:hypothetical protein OPV22_018960 [Ensete ventricosum]|uniref:RRM domain-containing protein n=1 Tax=Ensete ventricosum TaxID=4639 RepID=A0AAV8PGR9_ENSVE|nr:hypothetical protein OPV22_018960 [Ensete ventricosum]